MGSGLIFETITGKLLIAGSIAIIALFLHPVQGWRILSGVVLLARLCYRLRVVVQLDLVDAP